MKVYSRGGVGVHTDYRENIIVDPDDPVLHWKAAKEKFPPGIFPQDVANRYPHGLPRLGSQHSEDALSWNVFRSLERAGKLTVIQTLLDLPFAPDTTNFWHRRQGLEVPADIQSVLDCMEPWGRGGRLQQTETDVMLRGTRHIVMVESKLGTSGDKRGRWVRSGGPAKPMRPQYLPFIAYLASRGARLFNDSFDFQLDGRRFYQLFRNYLLGAGLSLKWNVGFSLLAVVNGMNLNLGGRSHEEEFVAFKEKLVGPSNAFLLTWRQLQEAIEGDSRLSPLQEYMSRHPCLNQ